MGTNELLLRAILCDPGDDTARLAYADYLEENGGERRAGFVRDCVANWTVVYDLRDELLSLQPGMTVAGFGKQDDGDGGRPYWRFGVSGGIGESVLFVFGRGFVDEVRLPAAAFTEDFARELFSRHPVTRVILTDAGARYAEQFADTGLPWSVSVPSQEWWLKVRPWGMWFETADVAMTHVSDSSVAWGRSLAGLPPLPAQHPVEG